MNNLAGLAAFSFLAFLLTWPAARSFAQQQLLPGSVDPGRFPDRFENPIIRKDPEIVPPRDFTVDTPIPPGEGGFLLRGVELTGLTAYTRESFQDLIDEYVGRNANLAVLDHLAKRITAHYRQDGYFLSSAILPAQEVTNGVIRVHVIESYVDRVILDDPKNVLSGGWFSTVQGIINDIEKLDPLHGPTLERIMLLLNDSGGIYVQSVLAAATNDDRPGGVDIVLRVEPVSAVFNVGYNNHGSKFIGPNQGEAAFSAGNFLNPLDNLSLQTSTSFPADEADFYSLSYNLPITSDGLRASFSISHGRSEPGSDLRLLEIESDSFSATAGLSYPVIRSRRTSLNLSADLTIQNTATEFLDQELIDDKLRVISMNANLDFQDDLSGINTVSLSLSNGLGILNASETGDPNLSRAQGRGDFIKLEASVRRLQNIGAHWAVEGQITGQYAPHPLLSSQEFGYGGAGLGAAYDPSEISGDQGVAAGIEVRYGGIEALNNAISFVPYSFYDIGKVWNEDRGSKPVSAATAGFGVYYQVERSVSGGASFAWPLTKSVNEPIMNGPDGPRVLLDISLQF